MSWFSFVKRVVLVTLLVSAFSYATEAEATKRKDLGKHTIAGVQLHAVLVDIANPANIAMGMGKTHYLEARFRHQSRKNLLTKGLVAVKVTTPNGETSPVQQMVLENGVYSADFSLIQSGTYRIQIGCRLYDGRKRQYEMIYRVQ